MAMNVMELMNSDLLAPLLALGIGLSVMLLAYVVFSAADARRNPLRRRLAELAKSGEPPAHTGSLTLGYALRPLGPYLLPKREKERETLRLKLIRAGFRSEAAAINLYAVKALLLLAFPGAALAWLLTATDLHQAYLFFFGFLAAFVGMMLPNLYLNHRIAERHREMLNALPDALDLLVSCTEAGLGLNAALQRVSRQIDVSSRLLAHELEQVNAEIRGGMDRIAALRNLTQRTGLDEIRGLVSLLSQSMRFGSSIADVLRIYSEEFRDKRMQRAEEQAALVGTKLIFPLCLCIFPAFFIVTVGPAVIGVVRVMAASGQY